ncbi:hypothetical protein FSPOR_6649 [Fusarium sporotrichioides]|uniref:RanBP2-type domain-containing protein n=1 Tax=Fusarium sporotrichioides TaxID=5514 RepID=A0A395S1N1_FUSSP|nr:hypothetical protein FSPOR_6649 [Fusarium sporotrichioides]
MPSGKVDKLTDKVRNDHTHWECHNCEEINNMVNDICRGCGESRLKNSSALNATGENIGQNAGKNDRGKELWAYYLYTNGNR